MSTKLNNFVTAIGFVMLLAMFAATYSATSGLIVKLVPGTRTVVATVPVNPGS